MRQRAKKKLNFFDQIFKKFPKNGIAVLIFFQKLASGTENVKRGRRYGTSHIISRCTI